VPIHSASGERVVLRSNEELFLAGLYQIAGLPFSSMAAYTIVATEILKLNYLPEDLFQIPRSAEKFPLKDYA
jgi:hypothetical protein